MASNCRFVNHLKKTIIKSWANECKTLKKDLVMRKGFTFVEVLVVLVIITIIFCLIVGAIGAVSQERQEREISPDSQRLEVVDGPFWVESKKFFIVKDKKTEIEFIYIYGDSICLLTGNNEMNDKKDPLQEMAELSEDFYDETYNPLVKPMSTREPYEGYNWIKVKQAKSVEIDGQMWVTEEHHIEETTFLIDEVRKLAKELDELKK